ncbi:putative sarcosine oxidase [Forsythia ovata]|uniref:Sarcosine oxidase n=1 Tax=Forsythia ovata TaxID=205694 RepID=A0ABD1RNZ9_9LAMI
MFDVIVIGAGVIGSSAAYQTAKRGFKTILLEQFDFLHHRGSSHGESRTIRATYPEDYYSSMVLESSHLWEEAEAEIGYKVYFKTIQFDMGPSDKKSLQAVITSCKENSIPVRVLDHSQVSEEFSGVFELPEDWIGVVTKQGGVLKPTKAVSMFQTLALKNGAMLRDNMEVTEIKKDDVRGGVSVLTRNGEEFYGKKCIVTVGPWMKILVQKVTGLVLPIQPLETAVHYWKIKQGFEDKFTIENGGFPTFASYGEPYIYGTPSLEFPGLVKIAVHGGRACEPNERTWVAALPAVVDSLKQWIEARFGGLIDPNGPVFSQSCMYSMTPDEDFVIDFLGGNFGKEVVVAGGFSGHGFKMAPLVGRILAELVADGVAQGVDLKYFSIGRFEGNPRGNVKDFDDQVKSH